MLLLSFGFISDHIKKSSSKLKPSDNKTLNHTKPFWIKAGTFVLFGLMLLLMRVIHALHRLSPKVGRGRGDAGTWGRVTRGRGDTTKFHSYERESIEYQKDACSYRSLYSALHQTFDKRFPKFV